jgi:hypothetical protein
MVHHAVIDEHETHAFAACKMDVRGLRKFLAVEAPASWMATNRTLGEFGIERSCGCSVPQPADDAIIPIMLTI